MTQIFHNPRCSKSRSTLAILEENKEEIEIVEYLKSSPSEEDIKNILSMLGLAPLQLIRKGEAIYKSDFKGKDLSDGEWIQAMVEHPILIERPIVIKNGKAMIGRPPESVISIL